MSTVLRRVSVCVSVAAVVGCSSIRDVDDEGATAAPGSTEAAPAGAGPATAGTEPAKALARVESAALQAKVDPVILQDVAAGQKRAVLVVLDEEAWDVHKTRSWRGVVVPAVEARAALYEAMRDEVLSDLGDEAPSLLHAYRYAPVIHVELKSGAELNALARHPLVLRVARDEAHEHHLVESLPVIGQPTVLSQGKTGSGAAVAVLDTGCDYKREAFGSCASAGAAGCKVAYAQDFGTSDNVVDDNGHGTNVSAIVLGVAPAAKILALDVFNGSTAPSTAILAAIDWVIANRQTYNIAAMNMSLGSGAYTTACTTSVFASAIANARSAGILTAASSGNDASSTAIGAPACVPAAVAVGATWDANVGGMSFSKCSDATTAVDKITCFSNSNALVSVLAPGAPITAGGYRMTGTSQASPHVAGAMAVLKSAFASETADQIAARLLRTTTEIRDARNGVTKPRLDLPSASAGCFVVVSPASTTVSPDASTLALTVSAGTDCPWSATSSASWITITQNVSGSGSGTVGLSIAANPTPSVARTGTLSVAGRTVTIQQGADTVGPIGSVSIDGGAPATRSRAVTLTIAASDSRGVAQMCVSNATSCTLWEPFATSKAWSLASGTGVKTVRVWFKDSVGNVSNVTDTIIVDTVAPTGGSFAANHGNGSVTLAWAGFTDALTSVASTKLVGMAGTTAPTCAAGPVLANGTASSFVHTGLTNGATYAYRVCAIDAVGNITTGLTATALPRPESVAPTGTLVINDGEARTKNAAAILRMTASDASGVSQMCISTATTCTRWEPFAATKNYTLLDGQNTLRAWFRDAWTNASGAATASILLDRSGPTAGTFSATLSGRDVLLLWYNQSDISGVARFTVKHGRSALAASCTTGTTVVDEAASCAPSVKCGATSRMATNLQSGSNYFRMCAVDGMGNINSGVARSVTVP